ncbi:MAG TPA: FlgD immunoglobulin-like domain containing protein [bacterium]|nr:FlgD immunoglobulin-like domain containing protein [bacterium]
MKRSRTAALLSLAIAASLVFGAFTISQANMLVNPGFEASGGSYDGWTVYASGAAISTPADDDIYRSGTAAAKIYGEFTNCDSLPQFDDGVVFQNFTATPGVWYEYSGYRFMSNADAIPGTNTCDYNRLLAKLVFLNQYGVELGGIEEVLGDYNTPLDEWIEFSIVGLAPEGTTEVQPMLIFLQPACDDGSVFVDDLLLEEVDPPVYEPNVLANPSFDFDLSGWTAFGNAYFDGRGWAYRTATGAAKLYGTFSPGFDSGMFQQFPATPGSIWKLDSWSMTTCRESAMLPGNTNVLVASLLFKDASGAELGTAEEVIVDESTTPGPWVKHTLMATAPAGTDSVAAYFLYVQTDSLDQGAAWIDDVSLYDISTVGVSNGEARSVTLHQNVPNPFNPMTKIAFELPKRGEVEVIIYNVAGREVATLHDGILPSGPHTITWDGRTSDGSMAASGPYWYMLRTEDGQTARSMVLLK